MHRYEIRLDLLGKLQAMPLEKRRLSLLCLGSLFSQSGCPLQLALSDLLNVYLIRKIISTERPSRCDARRTASGP
jgi:hypothetical protein